MVLKIKFVLAGFVLFGYVFLVSSCGCGDRDSQNDFTSQAINIFIFDEQTNEGLIGGFGKYVSSDCPLFNSNREILESFFPVIEIKSWNPMKNSLDQDHAEEFYVHLVDTNNIVNEDTIRVVYSLLEECGFIRFDDLDIIYNGEIEYSDKFDGIINLKI